MEADELINQSVEAIISFLDHFGPAESMTILDAAVGYVIALHGLPADTVIEQHAKNIADFAKVFKDQIATSDCAGSA